MADNQTEKQKVQELTDRLECGLTELFNSESYKNYLSTMSKFHYYSFNNTLLIAMQKPEASLVAGYKAWQKNFERHVNKGEKAIRILAPAPYKIKEERDKIDPVTQEIMLDRDGNPQKEEVEIMGNLLADELGNEYFVIGTDFYKTTCNLPVDENGKRKNHIFYSYDPMAKASKKCGFDRSYLDFEKIPDSSELKKQISECSWMGSLGEMYSTLYRIFPRGYRVWASPAELYDAMIYVSDAHPTQVIKD